MASSEYKIPSSSIVRVNGIYEIVPFNGLSLIQRAFLGIGGVRRASQRKKAFCLFLDSLSCFADPDLNVVWLEINKRCMSDSPDGVVVHAWKYSMRGPGEFFFDTDYLDSLSEEIDKKYGGKYWALLGVGSGRTVAYRDAPVRQCITVGCTTAHEAQVSLLRAWHSMFMELYVRFNWYPNFETIFSSPNSNTIDDEVDYYNFVAATESCVEWCGYLRDDDSPGGFELIPEDKAPIRVWKYVCLLGGALSLCDANRGICLAHYA